MGTLGAARGVDCAMRDEVAMASLSEESGVVGREGVKGGRRRDVSDGEGGRGCGLPLRKHTRLKSDETRGESFGGAYGRRTIVEWRSERTGV